MKDDVIDEMAVKEKRHNENNRSKSERFSLKRSIDSGTEEQRKTVRDY